MFKNIFICLIFLSSYALACSCIPFSLKEKVIMAKDIYVGVLISGKIIENNSQEERHYLQGTIRVSSVIKGSAKNIEKYNTSSGGSASCAISMSIGESYIIFMHNKDRYITYCGGSRTINRDKRFLNKVRNIINYKEN